MRPPRSSKSATKTAMARSMRFGSLTQECHTCNPHRCPQREVEFDEYFHLVSQSIDAFKKAEAQRKKALRRLQQLEPASPRRNKTMSELSSPRSKPAGSKGALSTEDQIEVAMKSAEALKKFHELDYDGSGVLEGAYPRHPNPPNQPAATDDTAAGRRGSRRAGAVGLRGLP